MDILGFIPQIIFLALIWGLLRLIRKNEDYILDFYFNRIKWQTDISKEEFYRYAKYLQESSPYFRNLSHDGKAKFVHRVKHILNTKEFEGRDGLQLTEKMVVLISGAIVQVTFGLDRFDLSHFTTIRLFPEAFYFRLYEKYLKGGTSKSGVILLSWKDFEEGYADEHDKYNLGLHEVAHALKLNVTEGDKFDLKFASYLDTWEEIGMQEFSRMREVGEGFLRDYAGGNMHEFFAVCVEHFFEASEDFKKRLPDIYNHLCVLLNQEPSNTENDYQLPDDFARSVNKNRARIPVPEKIVLSYNYVATHWSFSLTALGIIILWPVAFYLSSQTIITQSEFYLLAGMFIAIGIEQWFWFSEKVVMSRKFFPVYLIGGFSPAMMCIFLFINLNIPISTTENTYTIGHIVPNGNYESIIILSHNELQEKPYLRTFENSELFKNSFEPKHVDYKFSNGILGYKSVISKNAY